MSVVLLTDVSGALLAACGEALAGPRVARNLAQIDDDNADRTLVAFGTSVIVPAAVLARFAGRAYNLHAASPDYPGRDPHHFAVYDAAKRYGATFHVMTERVDDGPIIDVEWIDVRKGITPRHLLALANDAGVRLLRRLGPRLVAGEDLSPCDEQWGPTKRSRADFLRMCALDPAIDSAEFERRFRAFDGDAYDNLTIELHGRTFRIEKRPRIGLGAGDDV